MWNAALVAASAVVAATAAAVVATTVAAAVVATTVAAAVVASTTFEAAVVATTVVAAPIDTVEDPGGAVATAFCTTDSSADPPPFSPLLSTSRRTEAEWAQCCKTSRTWGRKTANGRPAHALDNTRQFCRRSCNRMTTQRKTTRATRHRGRRPIIAQSSRRHTLCPREIRRPSNRGQSWCALGRKTIVVCRKERNEKKFQLINNRFICPTLSKICSLKKIFFCGHQFSSEDNLCSSTSSNIFFE